MKPANFAGPFCLSAIVHLLLLSSALFQNYDDSNLKIREGPVKVNIVFSRPIASPSPIPVQSHISPPSPAASSSLTPQAVPSVLPARVTPPALVVAVLPKPESLKTKVQSIEHCAQYPDDNETLDMNQAMYSFTKSTTKKISTTQSIPMTQPIPMTQQIQTTQPIPTKTQSAPTKSEGVPSTPVVVNGLFRPPYPRYCRTHLQEGTVILSVSVSENGHGSSMKVVKSSGYRRLDSAASRELSKATFQAATIDGSRVKSTKKISFRFNLDR